MDKIIEKKLGDLLANSSDYELIGLPSQTVTSIAYNSKLLRPSGCFVAISGEKFDGHDYISDAIWNGAKAIVCEKLPDRELITPDVAFILTHNSRKLLAEISHSFYDYPAKKMKIIGVTGTNGKTTTTFLIKSIIESEKKTCGVIGTTGIFIGNKSIPATHTTPESLELAQLLYEMSVSGVEYVVMEVSSHSLLQERVRGIDFSAAVFTNLTHDHLDYHKTMDNYASAKKILFNNLSNDSFAVINSDSDYGEFMVDNINCTNVVRVGRKNTDNYRIMREKSTLKGTEFVLYADKQLIDVITSLAGDFNIDNAAISAAVCKSMGISKQCIQHGLSTTSGAPGRMQRINLSNGAVALVDYAHTPDALEKALLTCRNIINNTKDKNAKLICVFGCGGDRDKTKRPVMGKIASEIADKAIITSDNPRTEKPESIIQDIKSGINNDIEVITIYDRSEAIKKAVEISSEHDLILVAGKGHENYQIIGTEKFHFDDVEKLQEFDICD